MNLRLSIVVPMFNESEVIEHCLERLIAQKIPLEKAGVLSLQIIVIDDGSDDDSYNKAFRVASNCREEGIDIEVFRFSRNFGHSAAVLCGLESADGELIAMIDADLQDPPELLAPMVAKLLEGNEVVYGQRIQRIGESRFKRLSAWFFYRVLDHLSGISIPKDTGDFRVMTRQVASAVLRCKERDPFIRGLVAWVGFRQTAFPYDRQAREYGVTKYNFLAMIRFASTALVSFSSLPLRLAIYIGGIGLFITMMIGIWALLLRVIYGTDLIEPGWASTIIGYTVGQSVTLVVVGIVGIYIGRIHEELRNRPRYILWKQERIGREKQYDKKK